MSTPITLLPGTLPYDCYPPLPQTLNVDIITLASAFLNENFPGIYVGATEPAPEFRDRVWFHTVSTRWYYWINGAWQRVYEVPDGTAERRLWAGSEASLDTFAGGSPGVVGPSTGPLWAADHDFDGLIPCGPGNVATDPVTAVTQGANFGASNQKITITPLNLPPHNHMVGLSASPPNFITTNTNLYSFSVSDGHNLGCLAGNSSGKAGFTENFGGNTSSPPTADPVNVDKLPSVRGVFVIKRTGRVYVFPPY